MSAIDNTPVNKNFLSPLNFNFYIQRAPHLNFFAQSVNLPGVSFINPIQTNPFTNIPQPGDRIHFEDLTVTFNVDEDLQNYLEIHNWIRSLGFPENFQEYAQIKAQQPTSGAGIRSDLTLFISNGIKIPNFEVTFREAFPIAISRLNFQTTDSTIDYITASATFKYIFFEIQKL